tara:strand:- start:4539 stop:4697 length:159 start_codon:yes stop_codon:yes gene_type:complete
MSEQRQLTGFRDPEFLKCPYPALKKNRESAPVQALSTFALRDIQSLQLGCSE